MCKLGRQLQAKWEWTVLPWARRNQGSLARVRRWRELSSIVKIDSKDAQKIIVGDPEKARETKQLMDAGDASRLDIG